MEDPDLVIPIARRLETYLAKTHKQKDYTVMVPLELMRQKAATQRIFTIVTASIASISLLIGGIGIMNIMLANVSERRRRSAPAGRSARRATTSWCSSCWSRRRCQPRAGASASRWATASRWW
jgi:hypothetical protein